MKLSQFAASSCSHPGLPLEWLLREYSAIGFRKFEVFTHWAESRADYHGDPAAFLALAAPYGMQFTSIHLPTIGDDLETGLAEAIYAARFGAAIGVKVMIYKASTRENYIAASRPFLDAVDGLGVTPVLQNHVGTPITTLEDYRAVMEGINDPRMKTLLEVGMFEQIGVTWKQACELLDGTFALVHIKDQIGPKRMPFGGGRVDFEGLFAHLDKHAYTGEVVIEMEVETDDPGRLGLLKQAREYVSRFCKEHE